jgi:hypothetical protein
VIVFIKEWIWGKMLVWRIYRARREWLKTKVCADIDELRNLLIETRDHLIRTNQAVLELQAEVLKLKAAFERPPLAWGPEERIDSASER